MADPMTTIKDPNPITCPAFCREQGADRTSELASLDGLRRISVCDPPPPVLSSPSGALPSGLSSPSGAFCEKKADDCPEVTPSTTAERRDSDEFEDGQPDYASVHTVCKVYDFGGVRAEGCDLWPGARPFVNFLLEEGIKTVLRVNEPDEPGLAEIGGSYDAGLLAEFGIEHVDVPVSDSKSTRGALPPCRAVRRFFSLTRHVSCEYGGAVLIHCKGGFGRSVFLACLLVIYKYDVPGRGVLGWARIARPGAITTPEQEAVLRSLSGRVDLCRKYGIPCEGPDDTSGAQGCCTVS
jgi:hypothetical protein